MTDVSQVEQQSPRVVVANPEQQAQDEFLKELALAVEEDIKETQKQAEAAGKGTARQREQKQVEDEEKSKQKELLSAEDRALHSVQRIQTYLRGRVYSQADLLRQEQILQDALKVSQQTELSPRDRTILLIVNKSLADIRALDEKLRLQTAQIEEVSPEGKPVSSEARALEGLAHMLTGKSFEQLKADEQILVAQRMQLIASYLQNRPEYNSYSETEKQGVEALRQRGMQILTDNGNTAELLLERGETTDLRQQQQEADILVFLADPTGKVRRVFLNEDGTLDEAGYQKYRESLLNPKARERILTGAARKFVKGLQQFLFHEGDGKQYNFNEFWQAGLSESNTQLKLKALSEHGEEAIRKRIGLSEQTREYLEEVFGKDGVPESFIDAARKQLETKMREGASTQELLKEAAILVSKFNVLPTGVNPTWENFQLASALSPDGEQLSASEIELMCTVRGFILETLLKDLQVVTLAENQDPEFIKTSGLVLKDKKGHVRLVVLDQENGTGYFVDPSHSFDSPHLMEEMLPEEYQRISGEYIRQRETMGGVAIKTDRGVIGLTENVLTANNLTNLAVFISEEDPDAALAAAQMALSYFPSPLANLVCASLTSGAEQELYLQSAMSLKPDWRNVLGVETLRNAIKDRKNLTVEKVWFSSYEDVDAKERELRMKDASYEEWFRFVEQVLDDLNEKQSRGVPSIQIAERADQYAATAQAIAGKIKDLVPSVSEEQADTIKLYVNLRIHQGDMQLWLGQLKLEQAIEVAEYVQANELYRAHKNIGSVAAAYRARQAGAWALMVRDGSILTRHTKELNDMIATQLIASGYSKEEAERAATITELMWYVELSRPRIAAMGDVQMGEEEWSSQTTGSIISIYNPNMGVKQDMLSPVKKLMLDLMTPARYGQINRGAMDLNSGLGARYHIENAHKRLFTGKWGSHYQRRNGMMSMARYEETIAEARKFRTELEQGNILSRRKLLPHQGKDSFGPLGDFREVIMRRLQIEGIDPAQYEKRAKEITDEYIKYYEATIKRYNPDTDREEFIFIPQVLAEQLAYCEAHTLFGGQLLGTGELAFMLEKWATEAGLSAVTAQFIGSKSKTLREQGADLYSDMGNFINWRIRYFAAQSVASGVTARFATDHVTSALNIQDFTIAAIAEGMKLNEVDAVARAAFQAALQRGMTTAGLQIEVGKVLLKDHPVGKVVLDAIARGANAAEVIDLLGSKIDPATAAARQTYESSITTRISADPAVIAAQRNLVDARKNAEEIRDQFSAQAYAQAERAYDSALTTARGAALADPAVVAARTALNTAIGAIADPDYTALRGLVTRGVPIETALVQVYANAHPTMRQLNAYILANPRASLEDISLSVLALKTPELAGVYRQLFREAARAGATKESIAKMARQNVIDKPRYTDVLRWDLWVEYRNRTNQIYNQQNEKEIRAGTKQARAMLPAALPPVGNRDRMYFEAMRGMYEDMAKTIAGNDNNWNRINVAIRANPKTGLQGFEFTKAPGKAKKEMWELYLDNDAVIGTKVNLTGGEGYVFSYNDALLEAMGLDYEGQALMGTKILKTNFKDLAAASKNKEKIDAWMEDPSDEKKAKEAVGGIEGFDMVSTGESRRAVVLNAAVDAMTQGYLARLMPPIISQPLQFLFPTIDIPLPGGRRIRMNMRSPLAQLSNMDAMNKNGPQMRRWLEVVIGPTPVTSWKLLKRIRRRKGLDIYNEVPSVIGEFIALVFISLAVHTEELTGQK